MGRLRSFRTSPRFPRHISEAEASASLAGPDPTAIRAAACQFVADLCPWDLYATLTYDPARTGYVVNAGADFRLPPSPWACARHFAKWADHCALRVGRSTLAVGALEATRQGWPHFHVLLSMAGCSPDEFVAVGQEWYKPHGFCRLDRVAAPDAIPVATYLAKYFTKESAELLIRGELPDEIRPGQRWLTGLKVERSRECQG